MATFISFNFYKRFFLLFYVLSIFPWFFLRYNAYFTCILAFFSLLLFSKFRKYFIFSHHNNLLSFLLFIMVAWLSKNMNFFGWLNNLFFFFSVYFFIHLKDYLKTELLSYVTKWMAISCGVSACAYIFHMIGVPMPHTSIAFADHSVLDNYFLFVVDSNSTFERFRAFVWEPGHLTQGLIFLLIANKFDFKNKYVRILLFCQLLTLSLTGYICLFVCLLFKYTSGKKILIPIILFSLVVIFCFNYINSLGEGHFFYDAIIKKGLSLITDDSFERLRFGDTTIDMYEKMWKAGGLLPWTGYDSVYAHETEGAGYKVFIVMFGLVGVLIVSLFYSYLILSGVKRTVWHYIFIIVLVLVESQGMYPLWAAVLCSAELAKTNFKNSLKYSI